MLQKFATLKSARWIRNVRSSKWLPQIQRRILHNVPIAAFENMASFSFKIHHHCNSWTPFFPQIHNWTTDASVCKDSVSMHEAFENVAFHSNMNPCQITSESKHFHKSTLHSFETERTFKFLFWSGLFCLQDCFCLKADCFFFWRWLFPILKRIVFSRWFFTLLKEAQVNMRIMCGQLTKNVWLKNSA